MDRERLFELYEKLYFHELDVREKMLNRLQIPLALIVSIVSFYGFILNSLYVSFSIAHVIFYVLFAISAGLFSASLYHFIKAFFNHTYELIPTANTTESYRNELVTLYQSYPNADELVGTAFANYLYKYYSECSSKNTETNDGRAAHIHNCNKYLVLNILPIFLVFLFYSFGKLQVDPNGTPIVVEVSKPVMLQYESGLESGQVREVFEEIEPKVQQDQEHERQTDGQDTPTAPTSTTETDTP